MIVATGLAVVLLWPDAVPEPEVSEDPARRTGQVSAIRLETCPPALPGEETPTGIRPTRCGTADVRVSDGPDAGRTVTVPVPDGPGAPTVDVGDDVALVVLTDPEDPTLVEYNIVDHQRGRPLVLLTMLFAAGIVAFARWRGLAALAGLAVSFAVMLTFVVPGIMTGRPPLLVAVVGAAAIMFAVLYLTHGVSVRTSVAVLGTLASLILTGVGATLATGATHLTGMGGEEAFTLAVFYNDVDLHGLLLAGIIIGSLGVLDDVTVTQSATVSELAAANPTMDRRRLYRAASRVGRAHIASVVNTIVLAYAGASLPLLLLIVAGGSDLHTNLTSQFVAQEIVRSAVGTLGLIAAVPITTALAALLVVRGGTAVSDQADTTHRWPRPFREPDGAALAANRASIATPWHDKGD
jgi:uncharacterized membrane protein